MSDLERAMELNDKAVRLSTVGKKLVLAAEQGMPQGLVSPLARLLLTLRRELLDQIEAFQATATCPFALAYLKTAAERLAMTAPDPTVAPEEVEG